MSIVGTQWKVLCLGLTLLVSILVPASAQDEEEGGSAALECVGGLSVAHAHTSLAFIGVTADSFAKDVYEADTVNELMGGLIGGFESTKKMLRKLQEKEELSDEDEQFIDSIVGVYNALENEAKALIRFTKSKSEADAKAFEKARLNAVAKLEALIGEANDSDSDK